MNYLKKDLYIIEFIFMIVFAFGLISHGYFFSNSILSHDGLWAVNAISDLELKISSGRFIQYIVFKIRGWYNIPWIIGIMSLLWISCSVYVTTKTYNLKSKLSIFFVSIIFILNTSNIITIATYTHETDTYQLALLFALLSVYASKFKYGFIASIVFIAFSLGLYQGFISVIVVAFVLLSIIDVLDNKDFKIVILNGIKRILIIFIGCVFYLILMNLTLNLFDIELTQRANSLFDIDFSFTNFKNTINQGISYFKNPVSYSNEAKTLISFCYLLFIIIIVYNLITLAINTRLEKINILILIILSIVFIFSMNIMYFFKSSIYYDLMYYGNLFMLILGIILADKSSNLVCNLDILKINKSFRLLSFVLIGVIYFNNFIFANQSYFKKYTDFVSVNSTMTRIIGDMEDIEGYTMGETPILFSDALWLSPIYSENKDMPNLSTWVLTNGIISIRASYEQYFKNIMKYPINLHPVNYENTIGAERALFMEFLDMPEFPKKGYMKMVDGVVLIKLATSNNEILIKEALDLNIISDDIFFNLTVDKLGDGFINKQEFTHLLLQTYFSKTGGNIDSINIDVNTPFTDIDDPYVTTAYNLGIVRGTGATLFEPNNIITRQDAAIMVNQLTDKLNLTSNSPKKYFDDEKYFNKNAVDAIYNVSSMKIPEGIFIMNGTGDNNFSPMVNFSMDHAIITMLRVYKYE